MEKVSSKQWTTYARRALVWMFWGGYILFPVASGAWANDQVECVYPWSAIAKNALSVGAYCYGGFFAFGLTQPADNRGDISAIGLVAAIVLGGSLGFQIWQKCI